jgi:hypothetical protein
MAAGEPSKIGSLLISQPGEHNNRVPELRANICTAETPIQLAFYGILVWRGLKTKAVRCK